MQCRQCKIIKDNAEFTSSSFRVCDACHNETSILEAKGRRRCINCRKIKRLSEFYPKEKRCKVCCRAYSKSHKYKVAFKGYVYFVSGADKIKIGVSKKHPADGRLHSMQTDSPVRLELIGYIISDDMRKLEIELHTMFGKYHSHGEWFFKCDEILNYIKNNAIECSIKVIPSNRASRIIKG